MDEQNAEKIRLRNLIYQLQSGYLPLTKRLAERVVEKRKCPEANNPLAKD